MIRWWLQCLFYDFSSRLSIFGGDGGGNSGQIQVEIKGIFLEGARREEGVVRRRYRNILAGEAATLCN